jgi:hypothetical protein
MPDTTFNIVHAEPLDRLPEHWHEHWQHVVSREAGLVYEALADDRLAGTEVSITRFARYLGISKTRFGNVIQELEGYGFLWLDAEERPPTITVNDVPEVDPDAPPVERRVGTPKTPWRTVWEFVNHWCELHERHIEEPYPRPQRGRGRDTALIDEMLRTYSLETLKQVATWFFRHRRADEPSTLPFFQFHLPRLVSEWKDEGGVALPKMRDD